ncbi:hypothetical protein N865_17525 [Intrasporangium oryzae NRRL B-24470]|uniref:Lecithin:cholesterol acyltransferase n=1 Tax=Intrasporangium oryzae NRRL B-24470 TaxID=1386089 RepID=W9G8J7_9MICO|nr:hypothetical protein [Intrasporangium oryzae]EWT00199.1 hypothetical protein N865_17525 [Intrasporangium oryzae NRRL B-24470]
MTDTDLVVVLPGIMGSILGVSTRDRSAAENLVWAPTAGAVWNNLTGRLRIQDFPIPEGCGDEPPGDRVEAVELMPDVHAIPGVWTPVKGYTPLVEHLEQLGYRRHQPGDPRPGNLLTVPYDWRLSNRYNGQRLAGIVEPALDRWRSQGGRYANAQLVFVCHSMGGLVARWYIEKCGGFGHTRRLITLGTPWRGAASAVEQLVNGVTPGIGPLHVDLTTFARSLPSLYQLMPEYACMTNGPRDYQKTTAHAALPLPSARVTDAMSFYTTLQDAEVSRPDSKTISHAIVGTRQPTTTTISINPDGTATAFETFGADNDYGDGTVPLTGAIGHDEPLDTPRVFRVRDGHGNLHRNPAALDQIEEILTTASVRRRASQPVKVRVRAPDLTLAAEALQIEADIDGEDRRHALRIVVTHESGRILESRQPTNRDGHAHATFTNLPPGTHTITVDSPPNQPGMPGTGPNYGGPIEPVTTTTLIWPNDL